jgi:hypothetical protein
MDEIIWKSIRNTVTFYLGFSVFGSIVLLQNHQFNYKKLFLIIIYASSMFTMIVGNKILLLFIIKV